MIIKQTFMITIILQLKHYLKSYNSFNDGGNWYEHVHDSKALPELVNGIIESDK